MARVQLAHAYEAEIREVGAAVCVAVGQPGELRQVLPAVESLMGVAVALLIASGVLAKQPPVGMGEALALARLYLGRAT